MNMYLHGDGSNRIYWFPDSLDKEMIIEDDADIELKTEAEEIKDILQSGFEFDVVLTNPPFSMKYETSKEDEKKILEEYEVAKKIEKTELYASVRSNILFVERYYDLLKDKGRLLTVIDDGALCTPTGKKFRDFVRNPNSSDFRE